MNEKKIALVTGASRGIGMGIALALARLNIIVLGTATTEEGAQKISALLVDQGLQGQGYVMNVAQSESIEAALAAIKKDHGAPAILVNNAGITRDNLMLRMREEEWEEVINTNLTSVYRLSKACLKDMLKARWGRIINISSVVGVSGSAGQANYVAAKAGMMGFTKALAAEIASRNITVNAVAPGFIETEMTQILPEQQKQAYIDNIPMHRAGSIEDVASAVAFLAGEGASYITGQTLHVNGGLLMV